MTNSNIYVGVFTNKILMKKFFSVLILTLVFLSKNFAQMPEESDPKMPDIKELAQHETDRMKKGLILTDSQVVKVNLVNMKFLKQRMEVIHEVKESGDFSQIQNKVDGIELAKNEDLRPILTEEQMKKWPKLRQKMQNEQMNRNSSPNRNSGMRGGGMRQNDYGVNHN